MKTLSSQIEQLVLERKSKTARALIKDFLKKGRNKPLPIAQACDWLKRLGLYREALKLLLPIEAASDVPADSWAGKHRLMAASLLNQLGAVVPALRLLNEVVCQSPEDLLRAAHIHMANSEYSRANELYRRAGVGTNSEVLPSYPARFSQLCYADTWAGLDRFEEAIEIAQMTFLQSTEPLLQAIALQCKGEYLARAGHLDRALEALKASSEKMPTLDETVDSGILFKWLGYVHGMLGDTNQALAFFEKAERILSRPTLRIEALLDLKRLKARVVPAQDSKEELFHLFHYPGLSAEFGRILRSDPVFQNKPEIRHGKWKWKIDLNRDEVWSGDRPSLGISKEFELLAILSIAGSLGISLVRVQSILWPDDVAHFLLLEARVFSLLNRLRKKHKIGFHVAEGLIRLDVKSANSIVVCPASATCSLPSFFNSLLRGKDKGSEIEPFQSQAVATYYGCSSAQAKVFIRTWTRNHWIRSEGRARSQRYRLLLSP